MLSVVRSSKRISSPTVLRGELSRFGVGIGTLRKGGDSVRGGIGVGDGDVNDKFSVPDRGDLRLVLLMAQPDIFDYLAIVNQIK